MPRDSKTLLTVCLKDTGPDKEGYDDIIAIQAIIQRRNNVIAQKPKQVVLQALKHYREFLQEVGEDE